MKEAWKSQLGEARRAPSLGVKMHSSPPPWALCESSRHQGHGHAPSQRCLSLQQDIFHAQRCPCLSAMWSPVLPGVSQGTPTPHTGCPAAEPSHHYVKKFPKENFQIACCFLHSLPCPFPLAMHLFMLKHLVILPRKECKDIFVAAAPFYF